MNNIIYKVLEANSDCYKNLKNKNNKIESIMNHQLATIDFLFEKTINNDKNILIFHKMGSGKTILSLTFALIASLHKKIIIILPNINIEEIWKKQIDLAISLLPNLPYNLHNIIFKTKSYFMEETGRINITNIMLNRLEQYKDSTIIIDEAHNYFGNDSGNTLIKIKKLIDCRYILLTGSPITNTIVTIKDMISILTDEDFSKVDFNRFIDLSGTKVYDKKINEEGIKYIKNTLTGHVSFFDKDATNIPEVVYKGKPLFELPIIECRMKDIQKYYYLKIKDKITNEMFLKYLLNASFLTMGDIDNYINFTKYIEDDVKKELVDGLTLISGNFYGPELNDLNISSKFKYFIENRLCEKNNAYKIGKTFSYFSNSNIGSRFIRAVMTNNGISEYGKEIVEKYICGICYKKRTCDKCYPLKFAIITSKDSSSSEDKNSTSVVNNIINLYNKKTNDRGLELMFLFGSKILSEAFTLTEVREIWFFTPPDTKSEFSQIKARALRSFSYKDIKKPVNIYILIATLDKIDLSKFKIKNNEIFIKEIESNKDLSYDIKKILYLEIKSKISDIIHSLLKSLSVNIYDKINDNVKEIFILEMMRRFAYNNSKFKINSFKELFLKDRYDFLKDVKFSDKYIIDENYLNDCIYRMISDGFVVINQTFGKCILHQININEIITYKIKIDYNPYLYSIRY